MNLLAILHSETASFPGLSRLSKLARGARIYTIGDPADYFCVIESGLIKLTGRLEDNREVIGGLLGPGDVFGERAVLYDGPRDTTAEAAREATLLKVPVAEFRDYCRRNPEVWIWLAGLLAQRIDRIRRRMELVSFFRVEQRILYSLADLAEHLGSVDIPLSQADLANLVGATRETTSSMLNALEKRGLLQLGRRHVVVPSPETLRLAAHGTV